MEFLRRNRRALVALIDPSSSSTIAVDVTDPCTVSRALHQVTVAVGCLAESSPALAPGAAAFEEALAALNDELEELIEYRIEHDGHRLPLAFEKLPQPLFIISANYAIEPLNASARQALLATDLMMGLSTEASQPRTCHRVLFRRDEVCQGCPLDEVIDDGQHRSCGGVGVSPWTAGQAVAFFEDICSAAPAWTRTPPLDSAPPPSSMPSLPPISSTTDPPPSIGRNNALISTHVLNAMSGGVFVVDEHGVIVFKNIAAERIFGEPLEGKRASELPGPMDLTTDETSRELHLSRPEGDVITIGYRCLTCELFGRPGILVGCQDITEAERRRAERAQTVRLSEVGRMCTAVAHEIRNPLAGIKATIQSIGEDASDPFRHTATTVEREVDRLSELLNDFLRFARHRPVRREPTDWRELSHRAWKAMGKRAAQMTLELEDGSVGDIDVDPHQMKQVLLNLFLNSGDACDWNGTVSVSAENAPAESEVRLRVSDDGPGVPSSQRESLFSPFVTSKTTGTGLGLAICERLVAGHDGHISLVPTETGATFIIHLPTSPNE